MLFSPKYQVLTSFHSETGGFAGYETRQTVRRAEPAGTYKKQTEKELGSVPQVPEISPTRDGPCHTAGGTRVTTIVTPGQDHNSYIHELTRRRTPTGLDGGVNHGYAFHGHHPPRPERGEHRDQGRQADDREGPRVRSPEDSICPTLATLTGCPTTKRAVSSDVARLSQHQQ